ncbi:MAG: carbon-nitrogen hydrolase family protein [Deltaproteobacteria bacterium]|nr:carbon-nitrogen hydrolase family protein [Deltaproteobacteria bacterium]
MTVSAPEALRKLRVAAVQMTSSEDIEGNLTTAAKLVRQATADGARLIGLPENFAFVGTDRDHRLSIAEPLEPTAGNAFPGKILGGMMRLAAETGVHLLLGGFPEQGQDATQIRNTAVLLGPDGRIEARYRKIHLFDVDLPGGARFRESETIEAGKDMVVAQLPWGGLGLSICYDLRFPELYRGLMSAGARVLAIPSAFTAETGKDHWHVLLRARAIENQAFVLAPAQFGLHGGQRRSYGHALIVDPWGTVIAECGDHEGFALGDLDFGYQDTLRARLPCLTHRRL